MVGLMETSFKRAYANKLCLPGLLLPVSLTPQQAGNCQPMPAQETPKHSQEGLAQFLVGVTAPLPWCAQGFFLFPPSISASLSPAEVLYSNLDDLQRQIPWGFLIPLLDPPGWEA